MKTILAICLASILAGVICDSAAAQQIFGTGDRGSASRLNSLKEFTVNAEAIAEVYVQSVFPASELPSPAAGIPGLINTDALLRIVRVLKGDQKLTEIVINQLGGTLPGGGRTLTTSGNRLVQPGEHYIVFLAKVLPNGMTALPKRDLARYSTMGTGGWLTIEQPGIVRLNNELSFAKEYDGKTLAQVVSAIEMSLDPSTQGR